MLKQKIKEQAEVAHGRGNSYDDRNEREALRYFLYWNKDFQKIVLPAQASDGHWPHGGHFHGDTDIYRTTMTILMLEVYYRYAPMGGGKTN